MLILAQNREHMVVLLWDISIILQDSCPYSTWNIFRVSMCRLVTTWEVDLSYLLVLSVRNFWTTEIWHTHVGQDFIFVYLCQFYVRFILMNHIEWAIIFVRKFLAVLKLRPYQKLNFFSSLSCSASNLRLSRSQRSKFVLIVS